MKVNVGLNRRNPVPGNRNNVEHKNVCIQTNDFNTDDWGNDQFHRWVRDQLKLLYPGWSLTGYAPHRVKPTSELYLRYNKDSRDEYDRPISLCFMHPEVGEVTVGCLKYGCTEVKEMFDLERFAVDLMKAYNKEYGNDQADRQS